jgi:molybdopterin-guanine dinucleotide biosynthesis protein A
MRKIYQDVSIAVLVGGVGKRLGFVQKALLQYPNQDSFLKRLMGKLEILAQTYPQRIHPSIMISAAYQCSDALKVQLQNEIPSQIQYQWVQDPYPQSSALDLIVFLLQQSITPWLLIISCDMPLIRISDLSQLIDLSQSYAKYPLIYQDQNTLHPLFALWHQDQLEDLKRQQHLQKQRKLQEIIADFPFQTLCASSPYSLLNINTLEDWTFFKDLGFVDLS